jgi:hypothetical protein
LFVSVAGDEARFGLGAIDRLGNLPAVCVDFLLKLQGLKTSTVGIVGKLFTSLMLIVLTPILLLFSLIRLAGYWDDRIFDHPWICIKVSTQPNIRWSEPSAEASFDHFDRVKGKRVIRARYSRPHWFPLLSKGTLHHSGIYERVDVLKDIKDWIKLRVSPPVVARSSPRQKNVILTFVKSLNRRLTTESQTIRGAVGLMKDLMCNFS